MSRIVLAPYGSLGDLHPFLALAIELRERGHDIHFCTLEPYREKLEKLDFEMSTLRPTFSPDDRVAAKEVMDERNGSETLIKNYLLPSIRETYADLTKAVDGADLLIPGEVVFAAKSVAEKTGIRMATTTLAPLSMFSTYDANIYPNAQFLKYVNFLGRPLHTTVFALMERVIEGWLGEYKKFRHELGLDPTHNPITDKFSDHLHLAMFSKVLGAKKPDWPKSAVQTGFCFYDGSKDFGEMPQDLEEFLEQGEPPIVFTLGSAAVMVAEDFFEESIAAAKLLNRRAVFLFGIFNESPDGLDTKRRAFDYAPFGKLFPRAACVVHQGGVGTTAQVLRAGVPHLIVPFSHDQPDNANRCVERGVAETVSRESYNRQTAVDALLSIFSSDSYRAKARTIKRIIDGENGIVASCDEIEDLLKK